MGLRSTLKKVGVPSKIDYAANGREAVRKHKNLFDKGYSEFKLDTFMISYLWISSFLK
jgi:hypothetical protein